MFSRSGKLHSATSCTAFTHSWCTNPVVRTSTPVYVLRRFLGDLTLKSQADLAFFCSLNLVYPLLALERRSACYTALTENSEANASSAALAELGGRAARASGRIVEDRRTRLRGAARGLPARADDLLALPRQRLDQAGLRLGAGLERNRAVHERRAAAVGARLGPHLLERALERRRARLDAVALRLEAFPPTLARRGEALSALSRALTSLDPARPKPGFARVEAADGAWLTSAAVLTPGLKVRLVMPDGAAGATVDSGSPRVAAATPLPRRTEPDQGALF